MTTGYATELSGPRHGVAAAPRVPAQPLPADAVRAATARDTDPGEVTLLAGFSRPGARFAAIDQVLVSPGGVFVVVDAPEGVELVAGSVVGEGGDGAELLARAADAAAAVAELLPRSDPAHVHAVLRLPAGADADSEARVDGVLVCPAGAVDRLVRSCPPVVDAAQAAFLGRRLAVQQQPLTCVPAPRTRRRRLRGLLSRG